MKTCFLIFNYRKFAKFVGFLISNIAINFYIIYMCLNFRVFRDQVFVMSVRTGRLGAIARSVKQEATETRQRH